MNTKSSQEDRVYLLNAIKDKVVQLSEGGDTPSYNPNGEVSTWILDFRRAFSYPSFLQATTRLFWEEFDIALPWQIGGMESASLPLVTALALSGNDVRSFYIRKSRKKQGLLKQIEGDVDPNRDIILVDDLMNSGSSILKQITVLERELGLKVKAIFSIVRFRDLDAYKEITDKGIVIKNLFELSELGVTLTPQKFYRATPADTIWQFVAHKAHFFQQGSKNIPIVYRDSFIQTIDDGTVRQFDQATGKVRWNRRVMFNPRAQVKPFVCSRINGDVLYLTTYRGGLLALEAATGAPRFKLPVEQTFTNEFVFLQNNLITGVNRGRGWDSFALVAVNLESHEVLTLIETKWAVVGAMLVDEKRELIVVADTGNTIYCTTLSGDVHWVRACGGVNVAGVGTNEFGDAVIINNEGVTMVLHVETGKTLDSFTLPEFHAAPPTVKGRHFYGSTLGRQVYRYDYVNHTMDWSFEADGRIYSAPTLAETTLVVGDNNGRVYTLEQATGEQQALAIMPERVTNPVLITPTGMLISTFANDLYMLKRGAGAVQRAEHGLSHQATNHDSKHHV